MSDYSEQDKDFNSALDILVCAYEERISSLLNRISYQKEVIDVQSELIKKFEELVASLNNRLQLKDSQILTLINHLDSASLWIKRRKAADEDGFVPDDNL